MKLYTVKDEVTGMFINSNWELSDKVKKKNLYLSPSWPNHTVMQIDDYINRYQSLASSSRMQEYKKLKPKVVAFELVEIG